MRKRFLSKKLYKNESHAHKNEISKVSVFIRSVIFFQVSNSEITRFPLDHHLKTKSYMAYNLNKKPKEKVPTTKKLVMGVQIYHISLEKEKGGNLT